MSPSPEVDAIKAFAKKHKTKKICLNHAKYSRLMLEWEVHVKEHNGLPPEGKLGALLSMFSIALNLDHLDWSVSQEDRWAGIFARIDNVDIYYHDGQPEEMRVWPMTKSSSTRSK